MKNEEETKEIAAKRIQRVWIKVLSNSDEHEKLKSTINDHRLAQSFIKDTIPNITFAAQVGEGRYITAGVDTNIIDNNDDPYLGNVLASMNAMRKHTGKAPVDFVNLAEYNESDQQSFWQRKVRGNQSRVHIPPAKANENIKKSALEAGASLVVSTEINRALESKCSTAEAIAQLNGPEGQEIIKNYLKMRGVSDNKSDPYTELTDLDAKTIRVSQRLKNMVPKTGNVRSNEEFLAVMQSNRDNGIVFQLDESASGKGTLILSADKIDALLKEKNSDEIITFAAKKLSLNNAEEMASEYSIDKETSQRNVGGISWQELIPLGEGISKEGSIQFMIDHERKEKKDGKPLSIAYATSIQYCGDEGEHIGNSVRQQSDRFNDMFNNSGIREDYTFAQEIILDQQLKNSGLKEGLHDKKIRELMYSTDYLFELADPQELRLSEFNARPSFVSRALAATASDATALDTDYVDLQPGVTDKLFNNPKVNPTDASAFLSEKCMGAIERAGGQFDHLQYRRNSKDNIAISLTSIFSERTDTSISLEQKLEANQQAANELSNITAQEIDLWLQEKLQHRRESTIGEFTEQVSNKKPNINELY